MGITTELIREAVRRDGSPPCEAAVDALWRELREAARSSLARERSDHTLQPTDLASECFVRLLKMQRLEVRDRGRFFSLIHKILLHVLVDHARSRGATKRGEGRVKPLAPDVPSVGDDSDFDRDGLIDLDTALEWLRSNHSRFHGVVHDRYLVGKTHAEMAHELGCSETNVRNMIKAGLAYLFEFFDRA